MGFTRRMARRDSRRWLSSPGVASVAQPLGRGPDAVSSYPQYPPTVRFYCALSHTLVHPALRGATVARSVEPPTKERL